MVIYSLIAGDKPWDFYKVALGSWSRAEEYAQDIISVSIYFLKYLRLFIFLRVDILLNAHQSMNNWVAGWIDWNLALDEQGGPNWVNNFVDAAIIVNKTADEFYKQPMFYALGHFSKFIPPGSVRMDGSSSRLNVIQTLSVKRPDNSFAVIFLNKYEF